MSALFEAFFDVIRQGLPTIGAIGGLTWATADGVARDRTAMLGRGLLGASLGWGAGYVARLVILNVVDNGSPEALPNNVASLGPSTGAMGWTEPGTMPNPTQHPESFANKQDLPLPQALQGETDQQLRLVQDQVDIDTSRGEDIRVQGTMSSEAFGKV